VAWRRISAAARGAGLDPEVLSLLAEAIFAYIDELSADSVEGYAEAQAEHEDRRRRLRRELATLLVREPQAPEGELRSAAREAGWPLPRRVAAIACPEPALAAIGRRLPADALAAVLDGTGCVLLPDPDGPGRAAAIARATTRRSAALGPAGEPGELPGSWSLARAALDAAAAGALASGGLVVVDEHLGDLLVRDSGSLGERLVAVHLGPFEALTEKAGERMRDTALAYLRQQGNSVAVARELHVHPQTARYRVARLRELLGERLDDPDARFELEVALRARAFSDAASAAAS
jgi:hypothetical protein